MSGLGMMFCLPSVQVVSSLLANRPFTLRPDCSIGEIEEVLTKCKGIGDAFAKRMVQVKGTVLVLLSFIQCSYLLFLYS